MTLIYQAYGRAESVRQTMFSVLSFLRWQPKEKVMIYTDQAEQMRGFFAGLSDNLEFIRLEAHQLQNWRGPAGYLHRIKLEILLDATTRTKDSLMYVDADTVFMKDPKDIIALVSPGQSLMHSLEATLDQAKDPWSKKAATFCKGEMFKLKRGIVSIPATTEMWSAAVIGIHESRTNLLSRMLELTDVAGVKHQNPLLEQLAVSYFLQSTGKVLPADGVMHYHQAKEAWQTKIDRLFEQHPTAVKALPALATFDYSQPEVAEKKTWWDKLRG